jgi:predicted ribosome quality control (RQC) complex YloA/Tae2 family protein
MSSGSKGRFDGLDVQAMVSSLQSWCGAGRRVVNIYDGANGDSYVIKLEGNEHNNTTGSAGGKEFLLLESGIRFHAITNFVAEAMPTPFCAKLRKHVRGLRLESITQMGQDRVVLFQFGAGAAKHCLILELYAKGNLILTDGSYTVLALLRSHVYHNETTDQAVVASSGAAAVVAERNNDVVVRVGQVYPVSYATSLSATPNVTGDDDQVSSTTSTTTTTAATALSLESAAEFNAWARKHVATAAAVVAASGKKKKKGSHHLTIKTLLAQSADSGVMDYGPALVEHCIRMAGLDPHMALVLSENDDATVEWLNEQAEWQRLREALVMEGPRILAHWRPLLPSTSGSSSTSQSSGGGFILYQWRDDKTNGTSKDATTPAVDSLPHADKIFQEFLPVLLKQHEHRLHLEYPTFGAAVEDYFAHVTQQKVLSKAASAEQAAVARLDKIRRDQEERLAALARQQTLLEQQAATVQWHADNVDKALAVINSAIDSGMDWDQLEQIVAIEQTQNHNPIALLIHKLELESDSMILRLPTIPQDSAEDDDENPLPLLPPTIDVSISLKESAYANANRLFAQYRSSKEKSVKTVEASAKALDAAELAAQRQLSEAQKRRSKQSGAAATRMIRKPAWYEKFHWFVTSDNYLVLGGRDAHQNEQLVKRYLRPGDAYLHADVHGAATCILRAKRRRKDGGGTEPIPLSETALREAGKFTICRSSAWASKMVTSAWWVEAHQVSKTAPSGEYLTVGSFMIRGKKTYLPPTPLEMGLAVLFKLGDDDSILRHKNERRDFELLSEVVESELESPLKINSRDKESIEEEGTGASVQAFIHGEKLESTGMHAHENDLDQVPIEPTDEPVEVSDDDDRDEAIVEPHEDATKTDPASQAKRGLSVRDRKLIKKYGSLEAAEKALASQVDVSRGSTKEVASSGNNGQGAVKRGQKSKLKRVEKKYLDQDEEDRALAMLALQGGEKLKRDKADKNRGKRKANVSDNQQKAAVETLALLVKDTSVVATKLPETVQCILAECVTVGSESEDVVVRWDKFDAEILQQLLDLQPVEAQVAAAKRLLHLKQSTRVDNFSSSLGGKYQSGAFVPRKVTDYSLFLCCRHYSNYSETWL